MTKEYRWGICYDGGTVTPFGMENYPFDEAGQYVIHLYPAYDLADAIQKMSDIITPLASLLGYPEALEAELVAQCHEEALRLNEGGNIMNSS